MILSCWNVHGVFSCLPELTEVASFSDIVFISEHWLCKDNLSILNTSFPNSIYSIATPGISKNNITRGGIAFLIRKSTEFNIQGVRSYSERIMSIKLAYGANELFIIGCLLPSTNVHFEEYKNVLSEVFDLFDELCEIGPVLICGDFNTDFINKTTSSKSKLLTELMHDRNLCSIFKMENQYTFQTKDKTSKSIIDYILVPEWLECEVKYKEIFNDFKYEISDHSPLLCEINTSNIFQLLPPDMSRNIPKWSSADPKNLKNFTETTQHLLNKSNVTNLSTDDIDQHLVHITASLLSAADQHIPYGRFRPHLKPYWKRSNLQIVHYEMRCARRIWKSEGSPRNKDSTSYVNYKTQKRIFRQQHRQARKDWNLSIFDEIDKAAEIDIGTFYKTAWRNTKRTSTAIPQKLTYNGNTADDVKSICNLWRDYYSDLAEEKYVPDKFDDDFKQNIDNDIERIEKDINLQNKPYPKEDHITRNDIMDQVKHLSKGKAPGPDFLTNEHLIHGGNKLIEHLCILFNNILECKYVPEMFRVGKIISIYKGKNKDKCNPTNYRGITLTSVISKLFEKILLSRVEQSFTHNNVTFPHDLQFGFRCEYGAIPACFVLKEALNYYISRGSPVFCAFLDNEKAFDRIWHNGLLIKLYYLNIDSRFWQILKYWYNDSKCFVSFGGLNSSLFKISQGVGQGRVLSAFMFLVYINDLLHELCKYNYGLRLGDVHIPGILLADDTALTSYSPKVLQNMLNIVEEYAYKWRLHYNPSKSVFVTFSKSQKKDYCITLFGNDIPQSDSIVYAGCLLQGNMKNDKLTERVCKTARCKIHSLYSIGVNKTGLHPAVSAKIWKRIVLPSAFYSCELWPTLSNTEIQKLEYIQKHFSRIVQGFSKFSPSLASISNLGLWTIQGYIDKCQLLFLGRLLRADHSSIFSQIYRFITDTPVSSTFSPTKTLLKTAEKYQLSDTMNSATVFNKKEFSKIVVKTIRSAEERQWRGALSADPSLSTFGKIHTRLCPNKLWYLVKEDPSKRLLFNFLIQLSSMKIVSKLCSFCDKYSDNYNLHILLECFYTLDDRQCLLEMILDIIDVHEYVLFENQDTEKQYLSLLGCIDETSFNDISFCKWKEIMLCVATIIYRIRSCFIVDCRKF